MTTAPYPAQPVPPAEPVLDAIFGSVWADDKANARPRLLLAALGVGVLAAAALPFRDLGVGTFAVLVSAAGVVTAADERRRTPLHLVSVGTCLLLASVVFLRDADWIAGLCVLAAAGLAAATLLDVRSFAGVALAGFAVPLAALRGLPWLGRSMTSGRSGALSWVVVRTVAISALLLLVFGALFASADALFAEWVEAVVPDLSIGTTVVRLVVLVVVAAGTLCFTYVAVNPPSAGSLNVTTKSVARTFEWLLPVAIVVALFAMLVVAQLAVMLGGHDYVRRTTGITYADYVHQGFAQMNVATLLTLLVVAVAAHKASRETSRDRLLLRLALGLLCALALVVVASAIYRMHVYEEAYGFTRLRLLVTVFEGWLGLLLVLVLAAGIKLRGSWVPMASVLTGALALLGLAWVNPDAYIASHNVERYAETGKADWYYLSNLSADAAPALAELPAAVLPCVVGPSWHSDDDWLEWNLGRARAADVTAPEPAYCREP